MVHSRRCKNLGWDSEAHDLAGISAPPMSMCFRPDAKVSGRTAGGYGLWTSRGRGIDARRCRHFGQGEGSGGLVVPVDDVPALARNVAFLLDHDEQARILGIRARKRVEQAFSLQTVGDQLYTFIVERRC